MSMPTVSSCDSFTRMYEANISRAIRIGTMMSSITAGPSER